MSSFPRRVSAAVPHRAHDRHEHGGCHRRKEQPARLPRAPRRLNILWRKAAQKLLCEVLRFPDGLHQPIIIGVRRFLQARPDGIPQHPRQPFPARPRAHKRPFCGARIFYDPPARSHRPAPSRCKAFPYKCFTVRYYNTRGFLFQVFCAISCICIFFQTLKNFFKRRNPNVIKTPPTASAMSGFLKIPFIL